MALYNLAKLVFRSISSYKIESIAKLLSFFVSVPLVREILRELRDFFPTKPQPWSSKSGTYNFLYFFCNSLIKLTWKILPQRWKGFFVVFLNSINIPWLSWKVSWVVMSMATSLFSKTSSATGSNWTFLPLLVETLLKRFGVGDSIGVIWK